ncbi:MAG: hypothetical protein LBU90_05515 [Bacteroidales bacterium]|jgi:hypothetical protein|nr:hypothetical protein [Bacteroidales bacterium]
MTEIILKNRISKQKLHSIEIFLQALHIDAEIKNTRKRALTKTDAKKKEIVSHDIFAEVRGMWADRDIDGETLRKQAWGIAD